MASTSTSWSTDYALGELAGCHHSRLTAGLNWQFLGSAKICLHLYDANIWSKFSRWGLLQSSQLFLTKLIKEKVQDWRCSSVVEHLPCIYVCTRPWIQFPEPQNWKEGKGERLRKREVLWRNRIPLCNNNLYSCLIRFAWIQPKLLGLQIRVKGLYVELYIKVSSSCYGLAMVAWKLRSQYRSIQSWGFLIIAESWGHWLPEWINLLTDS